MNAPCAGRKKACRRKPCGGGAKQAAPWGHLGPFLYPRNLRRTRLVPSQQRVQCNSTCTRLALSAAKRRHLQNPPDSENLPAARQQCVQRHSATLGGSLSSETVSKNPSAAACGDQWAAGQEAVRRSFDFSNSAERRRWQGASSLLVFRRILLFASSTSSTRKVPFSIVFAVLGGRGVWGRRRVWVEFECKLQGLDNCFFHCRARRDLEFVGLDLALAVLLLLREARQKEVFDEAADDGAWRIAQGLQLLRRAAELRGRQSGFHQRLRARRRRTKKRQRGHLPSNEGAEFFAPRTKRQSADRSNSDASSNKRRRERAIPFTIFCAWPVPAFWMMECKYESTVWL